MKSIAKPQKIVKGIFSAWAVLPKESNRPEEIHELTKSSFKSLDFYSTFQLIYYINVLKRFLLKSRKGGFQE